MTEAEVEMMILGERVGVEVKVGVITMVVLSEEAKVDPQEVHRSLQTLVLVNRFILYQITFKLELEKIEWYSSIKLSLELVFKISKRKDKLYSA